MSDYDGQTADTAEAPDVDVDIASRRAPIVAGRPTRGTRPPTLREYVASIPAPESLKEHGRRVGAQPTHRHPDPEPSA